MCRMKVVGLRRDDARSDGEAHGLLHVDIDILRRNNGPPSWKSQPGRELGHVVERIQRMRAQPVCPDRSGSKRAGRSRGARSIAGLGRGGLRGCWRGLVEDGSAAGGASLLPLEPAAQAPEMQDVSTRQLLWFVCINFDASALRNEHHLLTANNTHPISLDVAFQRIRIPLVHARRRLFEPDKVPDLCDKGAKGDVEVADDVQGKPVEGKDDGKEDHVEEELEEVRRDLHPPRAHAGGLDGIAKVDTQGKLGADGQDAHLQDGELKSKHDHHARAVVEDMHQRIACQEAGHGDK